MTVPSSAPIISIVIPVYQAERFLTQCLDSVLAQTLTNFEVICIDDGCTDGSADILDNFAQRDTRVIVIHQKNQGAGGSRNDGLAMARGTYTIFLDCDDYFEPMLLAQLFDAIEQEQADVAICRSVCFDDTTGKPLPSEWMRKDYFLKGRTIFAPQEMGDCLFQFTYGWAWDKLFRTEFLRSNQFVFPDLKRSHDLVFVYTALACAKQIAVISVPLIHYRMGRTGSVSHGQQSSPRASWEAVEYLQKELERRGKYDCLEQTFRRWAMEFLIWNMGNITPKSLQKQEFYYLKTELLPRYHFEDHPPDYYGNRGTYRKFLLVQNSPFWIYSAVLGGYRLLNQLRIDQYGKRSGG